MTELSIRGRVINLPFGRRRGAEQRTTSSVVQRWWLVVPLALVQLLIALDVDLPLLRPILALATFLGLPTLVLVRRAGIVTDSGTARLLYAFGASLLGLLLVALALNTVLPVVGIDHPLQPVVLAVTWLVLDIGLLAWRSHIPLLPDFSWVRSLRGVVDARFESVQTLATGALLVSVIGAIRLNNGEGGTVAVIAQVLAAAALVALMVRPVGSIGRDSRVLALVAGGLLLGTSLRGWGITGHDIQAEYLSFGLTNGAQHWSMGALQNAYNACLSVNILPTVLAQTTGLPGTTVFKLLLQLVFATVPVLTYLFSRRFLTRRLALVAAIFTMAFPTFFTDMPYLVRQEMAFFFLALLLLAATEPHGRALWQRLSVGFFGVGVVLSHYSTTYVMLMGLVFALFAMSALRFLGRRWARFGEHEDQALGAVLLNPFVVLFLIAISLTWAGPVTHTGAHAKDVARQTVDALTGQGAKTPGSSDTSYSLFSKDKATSRDRLNQYVAQTMEYRKEKIPARDLLIPKPTRAELRPAISPATTTAPTPLGKLVDTFGVSPKHLNAAAKVVAAGLMQVFLLAGLVWLLFRREDAHSQDDGDSDDHADEASGPKHEVTYLALGGVAALALIVLVPNLSVDYGVLRAFQQSMLVTAPVMAAGMWMLIRPLGKRLAGLAVVVPVVLLLVLAGVLPALLGGNQPRLALSNSGSYYDRFYTSDSETQAISWLAAADASTSYRSKIISNRNVAVKMLAATNNAAPIADRLYPTLLTKDAYVYVDPQIIGRGTSTLFYTGDLISYAYPTRKLDRRMDLVYSSPRSRIYR